MMFVLVLCAGGVWFYFYWMNRARRFVRAADFLTMLDGGCSVAEANGLCMTLFTSASDPDTDQRAIYRAEQAAAVLFAGKQLPLIALARSKGFQG